MVCQSDAGKSITSGGGFSNYYSRPTWQDSTVAAYYTNIATSTDQPAAGYNKTGRGFPDLSLAGYGYLVRVPDVKGVSGKYLTIAGTSASCPVAAAMFTNINAARLAGGKGPVGWVNPALYVHAASFVKDVVSGDNRCASNGRCCSEGFDATTGWDPASGLGSVNYAKMQAKFLSLGEVNSATFFPTSAPTVQPPPTAVPTLIPTLMPTFTPSAAPTLTPTLMPTFTPSTTPTLTPSSASPTAVPSLLPYQRRIPVRAPTVIMTAPSMRPSNLNGTTYFPTSTNLKRMASKQPVALSSASATAAPTSGRVSSVLITQVCILNF